MKHDDLEPLDNDLAALFDAERARPPAAAEARSRVYLRVSAAIGFGVAGGGGAGGAGAAGAAAGHSAAPVVGSGAAGSAAAGGVGAAGAGGGLATPLVATAAGGFLKTALIGLGAVVLGAVTVTTAAYRAAAPGADPAPTVGIVVAVAADAGAAATAVSESDAGGGALESADGGASMAAGPAVAAQRATASASASAEAEPSARAASLAGERVLLDQAQAALARGATGTAFRALERHAAEFSRSRLAEERDGLWIRALIRANRPEEALARASRFRRSYPRSMLIPALEQSLGVIP